MSINVGDLIGAKYRVERVIGAGGMGIVLAAWDPGLERRVAIKVLRPEMLVHADITQRFLREARAAARIQSDHVAQVMEVSLLADGTPFMVLEYLEGHDLSHQARGAEKPSLGEAVSWVIQACYALKEAHELGIVHRDLKPANLFLAQRRDGTARIKVLDFGISKLTDPVDTLQAGITRTAVVMGSPEYMSPEQMLSTRDVDARSDIWSLGVILYELGTGSVPYPGETATQVYARVVASPTVPPRLLRPQIPAELEAVILACLVVDRENRITSVSELVRRLTPWASATRSSGGDDARDGTRAGGSATTAGSAGGIVALKTPTRGPPEGATTGVVSNDALPALPTRPLWRLSPLSLAAVGLLGAGIVAALLRGGSVASHAASATRTGSIAGSATSPASGPMVEVGLPADAPNTSADTPSTATPPTTAEAKVHPAYRPHPADRPRALGDGPHPADRPGAVGDHERSPKQVTTPPKPATAPRGSHTGDSYD